MTGTEENREDDDKADEFDSFQRLTSKLVKVPKKEVDDLRKSSDQNSQDQKTQKSVKLPATTTTAP